MFFCFFVFGIWPIPQRNVVEEAVSEQMNNFAMPQNSPLITSSVILGRWAASAQ